MLIRVFLAGRVSLEVDSEVIIGERDFRARQERLAFAYLVLGRSRPVPRDELADALWGDDRPPAWPGALSAVVSRLRSLLAREPLPSLDASISGGFGQYQLHLPAGAWVDIEAAAEALDAAEGVLRMGDAPRAFGPSWLASTIAERPFLSDVAGPWVEQQRALLRRTRVRALECLARLWLVSGDAALAEDAAVRALTVEPLRESSYRLLMQAHALAGNPAEAVRAYHDLRVRLLNELGTDPSDETDAVYMKMIG